MTITVYGYAALNERSISLYFNNIQNPHLDSAEKMQILTVCV